MFVYELKLLKITDPDLFVKFHEGFFVVRKSKTKFSSIASNQAHQQTDKKSKSGLADELNEEDTLPYLSITHTILKRLWINISSHVKPITQPL